MSKVNADAELENLKQQKKNALDASKKMVRENDLKDHPKIKKLYDHRESLIVKDVLLQKEVQINRQEMQKAQMKLDEAIESLEDK